MSRIVDEIVKKEVDAAKAEGEATAKHDRCRPNAEKRAILL